MEVLTLHTPAPVAQFAFIARLRDSLGCRIFGKKSEHVSPGQLQLVMQEMETPSPTLCKEYGLDGIPAQPLRSAKAPSEHWSNIDEEVGLQRNFGPARFFRHRLVGPKCVGRCEVDAVPVLASQPLSPYRRSIADPGLIAHALIGKDEDHLRLCWQEGILWIWHQVCLPRQSRARWVEIPAFWLRPIYLAIGREFLAANMSR